MTYTEDRLASRRAFIKGAGAAGLVAIMAAGGSTGANAASYAKANLQDLSDVDILNFALSLEHLEAEYYKEVVASGVLSGDALTWLTEVRDNEIEHVVFLMAALTAAGADPVEALDEYNFAAAGDLSTQEGVLAVAEVLEETGVGAYTGAAPLIDNKDYLAAAGSIVQVEARHHAAIRYLNGKNPSPDTENALAIVLTVAEVQERIAPIVGS